MMAAMITILVLAVCVEARVIFLMHQEGKRKDVKLELLTKIIEKRYKDEKLNDRKFIYCSDADKESEGGAWKT